MISISAILTQSLMINTTHVCDPVLKKVEDVEYP